MSYFAHLMDSAIHNGQLTLDKYWSTHALSHRFEEFFEEQEQKRAGREARPAKAPSIAKKPSLVVVDSTTAVQAVVPGTGPGAGAVTSKDMHVSAAIVCPIAAHPSVASDDPVACDSASVEIFPSAPVTSGDAAELGAASGAAAEGAAPVPIKRKRGRPRKLVVENAENAADASPQEPAQSKGSQGSRPGICASPPPGASVWDDPEFVLFGFWAAGGGSNLPDCARLNLECGKRRRQHAYA